MSLVTTGIDAALAFTLIGMSEEPREKPINFIRAAVLEHRQRPLRRPGDHPLSARAERLPPHRTRQGISSELRPGAEFGGRCNLRFDDTNPTKESQEYVESIIEDVHWLGFDWGEHLYFASDYFEQLYEWAVQLIKAGKAYVDDLTADADVASTAAP